MYNSGWYPLCHNVFEISAVMTMIVIFCCVYVSLLCYVIHSCIVKINALILNHLTAHCKKMYGIKAAYFSHLACLSINLIFIIFKENYNWIIFT